MLFVDIVKLLKETPSINDKIEILKNINDNNKILMELTYNPLKMFNINIVNSENIGTKHIEDDFEEFINICNYLIKKDIPISESKILLNNYFSNLTKEDQDVVIKILNKDLKVGIGSKLLNKALGDNFIKEFRIQLANTYQKYITKKLVNKEKYFCCSPKMDGHRLFYFNNNLYSRNGKTYFGFDHILEELNIIKNNYPDIDDLFIDGELYSTTLDFNSIASKINSDVNFDIEEKKQLKYYIFAIGSFSNNKFLNTETMIMELNKYVDEFNYVIPVEYFLIKNHPVEVHKKCLEFMEQGYEGVMLRNRNISYDFKRSDKLLKYKIFEENDFIISELLEGKKGTDFENTLGSISCYGKAKYDDRIVNVFFNANFKGTDEERKILWEQRNNLIGKKIEVKYQGVSMDKNLNYSLRFPVATKIKFDR